MPYVAIVCAATLRKYDIQPGCGETEGGRDNRNRGCKGGGATTVYTFQRHDASEKVYEDEKS